MAVFRNLPAQPIQLKGDWRLALAEIFFATSFKSITSIEYSVYFPNVPV